MKYKIDKQMILEGWSNQKDNDALDRMLNRPKDPDALDRMLNRPKDPDALNRMLNRPKDPDALNRMLNRPKDEHALDRMLHHESTKLYTENDYADNAANAFADKVEDEPVPETIKTVGKIGLGAAAVLGGSALLKGGSSAPKRPAPRAPTGGIKYSH